MVGGEGETVTPDAAAETATVAATEVTVTGVAALSVTWSLNYQVPKVESVPVETEGVLPAVQEKELPRSL